MLVALKPVFSCASQLALLYMASVQKPDQLIPLFDSIERAIYHGFYDDIDQLKRTSIQANPDRTLLTFQSSATGVIRTEPKDVVKYSAFLEFIVIEGVQLNQAQWRDKLLSVDTKLNNSMTKCPNAMWRHTWAKNGAIKICSLCQYVYKRLKSPGTLRCESMKHLKTVWYSCHSHNYSE